MQHLVDQHAVAGKWRSGRAAHQLSDEELARVVGVPVDQLSHLALCGLPQKDVDVATIVAHVKADGPTLSAWLKTETHEENQLPDWAQPEKEAE